MTKPHTWRHLVPAVTFVLLAAGLRAEPAEVLADTGTAKVTLVTREWIDVGLNVNGVTVDRVRFHRPGKVSGLFTKHDEANRGNVVVTNGTDKKISPALAVAVFDKDGHLLAAANTGVRLKTIQPGETATMDLHFGGVFRFLEKGDTFYVSIEY